MPRVRMRFAPVSANLRDRALSLMEQGGRPFAVELAVSLKGIDLINERGQFVHGGAETTAFELLRRRLQCGQQRVAGTSAQLPALQQRLETEQNGRELRAH